MPVDVRGRIVYNPEADEPYTFDCKQLGIQDEGSGTIEEDIETLRERVAAAISDEFHVAPKAIQITGYSMSLNFSIEGPVNKTLDQYVKKDEEEVPAK